MLRYFAAILVLLVGVLAASYLQHRFDQSDIKHAVEAVKKARPKPDSPLDVEQILGNNFNIKEEEIVWKTFIESKWKGKVRVEAVISDAQQTYAWEVDVVRFEIKPVTPGAENLSYKN
jgi:hypothetical protein